MKRLAIVSAVLLVVALLVAAFTVNGGPDKDEWIAKCVSDTVIRAYRFDTRPDPPGFSSEAYAQRLCEQNWNKKHKP